jgi:hypothetical protein
MDSALAFAVFDMVIYEMDMAVTVSIKVFVNNCHGGHNIYYGGYNIGYERYYDDFNLMYDARLLYCERRYFSCKVGIFSKVTSVLVFFIIHAFHFCC